MFKTKDQTWLNLATVRRLRPVHITWETTKINSGAEKQSYFGPQGERRKVTSEKVSCWRIRGMLAGTTPRILQ